MNAIVPGPIPCLLGHFRVAEVPRFLKERWDPGKRSNALDSGLLGSVGSSIAAKCFSECLRKAEGLG